MNVKTLVFNPFQENTYIVWSKSGECAIIDPGMMYSSECQAISAFIEEKGLTPTHLLNTHMHIDHVAGNEYISKKYGLVAEGNIEDNFLAERVKEQAQMFGVPYSGSNVTIGKNLSENDIIIIGDESLKVIEIPGHSKGHIAFYSEKDGLIFTGDALFQLSIGRTDLPTGNYNQLLTSIDTKLMTLPDETVVYPGHGNKTTIGFEREHNPYII